MYRQRTQKVWGHTAHRGWARLLLNRARDLIIHDPAHHGANGAAMPTDEDDQDGHFFFNHPERGRLPRCLGTRSHCHCCLDPILPLRGGGATLTSRGMRPCFLPSFWSGRELLSCSSTPDWPDLKTRALKSFNKHPKCGKNKNHLDDFYLL